ncbi:MAG: hypothetical protein EAZ98_25640 [Oscillatoriales cyanobacterium]|nr:MAG: hypothetical protein EAZ98_25640 [Oscillatoriales cyanobacterium]TAE03588.1 MAG: hypothetical protein EAZ96_12335 [Oscillatoriales cyanobacterium]
MKRVGTGARPLQNYRFLENEIALGQKPDFFENTRSQCTDSAKNPVSSGKCVSLFLQNPSATKICGIYITNLGEQDAHPTRVFRKISTSVNWV